MKFVLLKIALILSISLKIHAQIKTYQGEGPPPLLEIGAGVVGAVVPDYPGAGHSNVYVLPFPSAYVRDEVIRADEDGGLRGRFLTRERYEINLSLGGSLPAKSKDNPDRSGMPDLDPVIQIGPGLIVKIIRSTKENPWKLRLNVPIRYAVSTDFKGLDERGIVLNPVLYAINHRLNGIPLSLFASIDATWAGRRLHEYFYNVEAPYVRSGRPLYRSKGGYMGSGLGMGLSYTYSDNWTWFGGVYHSYYQGAANQDSPLLVRRNTTSVGLGFIYWFYASQERGVTD